MSASRPGRKAEPPPWRALTAISRSMISPRSISSRCISPSIRSISSRNSARDSRAAFWLMVSFTLFVAKIPVSPPVASEFVFKGLSSIDASRPRENVKLPALLDFVKAVLLNNKRSVRKNEQVALLTDTLPDSPPNLSEAVQPHSPVAVFDASQPLAMSAGVALSPFSIAYQTYGELNADKSNAILLCHALTGDQHVASAHPLTGKPGWWSALVGPGRPFNTDKYFIICS